MTTTTKKPKAKVIGQDGNVFNLIAICSEALRKAGKRDETKQMQERILNCGSYNEALNIMSEYCELY